MEFPLLVFLVFLALQHAHKFTHLIYALCVYIRGFFRFFFVTIANGE